MNQEIEEKYKLIMENFSAAAKNLSEMNTKLEKVNDTYKNAAKTIEKVKNK